MGANAARNMQKTCLGVEWWGLSHFKTAHQRSGQRLPAGIPLQIMTVLCISQLCPPALSALPHTNSGPVWRYCEIFQEHNRTSWKSSVYVTFRAGRPCFWRNNTRCLAAEAQKYRDKSMRVHTVLDSGAPFKTLTPLVHVCPPGALSAPHWREIHDWWRVRLKPGSARL